MSREAEQALLGALLTQNSLIQTCDLDPVVFSDENHAEIYTAILAQINDDQPADIVSVHERLMRDTGTSYIQFLSKLTTQVMVVHSSFDQYVKLIRESYKRRQAVEVVETLKYELLERRNFDAIDAAISGLMHIEK